MTEPKNWPLADPAPSVVNLLARILYTLRSAGGPGDAAVVNAVERAELIKQLEPIVEGWNAREDLADLHTALGLNQPKRRRRTQRTVAFEYGLAWALAEHEFRGTPNPAEVVAREAHVDPKTVRRAATKWPQVKQLPAIARGGRNIAEIDYSDMLNRSDTK